MNLQSVVITGFKSFANRTEIGPFTREINCIYGLNGSGKSTIFQAIEFVLSDDFTALKAKERHSLLSTSRKGLDGSVKLKFSIDKDVYPCGNSELTITRSIGIARDELYINDRHSTRAELQSLFETFGLSLRSCFFMIPQGRIKEIAKMNGTDRLNLLHEIAGFRSYDERREESIQMLAETTLRQDKIRETIEDINDRLDELKDENEELDKFEEVDNTRRAIEFLITDMERSKIEQVLDENEKSMEDERSVIEELRKQIEQTSEDLLHNKTQLHNQCSQLTKLENQLKYNEKSQSRLTKKEIELNMKIEEYQSLLLNYTDEHESLQISLDEIQNEYEEKTEEQNQLSSKLTELKNLRSQLDADLNQGNGKLIEQISCEIDFKSSELDQCRNKINKLQPLCQQKEENFDQVMKIKQEIGLRTSDLSKKLKSTKEHQFELMDHKKEIYREESDLKRKEKEARSQLKSAEMRFKKLMGSDVEKALSFIESKNYEGVYGPLIKLISFNALYDDAVDSVAGSRLFHVVVDTSITATKLISDLQKNNAGRITFMALDKLRVFKVPELPDNNDDYQMLKDQIQMASEINVQKAVDFVFGSYVCCRNFEVIDKIPKFQKYNYVTLTGDLQLGTGAMNGGYVSSKRSKTKLIRKINGLKDLLEIEIGQALTNLKLKYGEIDEQQKYVSNEIIEIQNQLSSLEFQELPQVENDISSLMYEIKSLNQQLNNEQKKEKTLESQIQSLNYQKESLNRSEKLSESDRKQKLEQIGKCHGEIAQCLDCIYSLDGQLLVLKKMMKDYKEKIEDLDPKLIQTKKENAEEDLKRVICDMTLTKEKIDMTNDEISNIKNEIKGLKDLVQRLEDESANYKCTLSQSQRELEKLKKDSMLLINKRDDLNVKVANIGTFPTKEIEEFKDKSSHELIRILRNVNIELKNFRYVNLKARTQYQKFASQKDIFAERQSILTESYNKITDVIHHFDEEKNQALTRCIEIISKPFKNHLIQLLGDDAEDVDLVLTTARRNNESEENPILTGLDISYNGGTTAGLSGGQTTLIALALLFAIQELAPSPFYMFDEIDADLDPENRERVTTFLQAMSDSGVQIIMSTHKENLINISSAVFEVKQIEPDSSTVNKATKEQALQFVDAMQNPDNADYP